MRFIHTADLHWGAEPDKDRPWGPARANAIKHALERFVDICNKQAVDLLLISGDLFHYPPTEMMLREAAYQFSRLENTQVVLTAGDRDFLRPGCAYATYPFPPHVRLLASVIPETLTFPEWHLDITGFSYHADHMPQDPTAGLQPPDSGLRHFLMVHGGDAAHVPFQLAPLREAGWDYIALGHGHAPALHREGQAAMPGSPEPLNQEEGGSHGYYLGEMNEQGLSLSWQTFSHFSYQELKINITPEMSQEALEALLRKRMKTDHSEVYRLLLCGQRHPAQTFDQASLLQLGPVSAVIDLTRPGDTQESVFTEEQISEKLALLQNRKQALQMQRQHDLPARQALLEKQMAEALQADFSAGSQNPEIYENLLARQEEQARQLDAERSRLSRELELRRDLLRQRGFLEKEPVVEDRDKAAVIATAMEIYESSYQPTMTSPSLIKLLSYLSLPLMLLFFAIVVNAMQVHKYPLAVFSSLGFFVALFISIRFSRRQDAWDTQKHNQKVLQNLLGKYLPDYEAEGSLSEARELSAYLEKVVKTMDYLEDKDEALQEKTRSLAQIRGESQSISNSLEADRQRLKKREEWEIRIKSLLEERDALEAAQQKNNRLEQEIQSLEQEEENLRKLL